LTPATRSATSRFAAASWQGLAQDGLDKLPAVMRAALIEARTKALVQRNREEHNRLVAEFNQILETYRIGLEAIAPVRRLNESELVQLISRSLNPAERLILDCQPQDALLNTDWSEGSRHIDLGGVLKSVVTVSELPEAMFASLLRPLMALAFYRKAHR
jgi:hypothetical protein